MAKYFLVTTVLFLFGLLLTPLSVSAAWNTVTFTQDTNVVLGNGTTLIISSGGDVEAMRIYSTYVEFDMLSGSNVIITSNDRYSLANTLNAGVQCESTYSRISLSSSTATTETVTVTPGDICGAAGGGSGGGASATETTAPSISDISVSTNTNTTTIAWTTSESSISWIVYGTTTEYGSEEKTTSYATSHSLTLENLSPETTYHYQLKSKDSSGNIGTYTDQTFTTLAAEQAPKEIPVVIPEKPIAEMTIDELKAEITRITALIDKLRVQLTELLGKAAIEGLPAGFTFDKALEIGMSDIDVKYLQIVLNSNSDTRLAISGVGSPGHETNYFGPLTKAAVIKFQENYSDDVLGPWGLTKGTGYVGKTSRNKLNELLGE